MMISIIDLLKEVKEGNAPKMIRYRNNVYTFDLDQDDYKCDYGYLLDDINTFKQLNDEVKILDNNPLPVELNWTINVPNNIELANKVNEIIKYLKSCDL